MTNITNSAVVNYAIAIYNKHNELVLTVSYDGSINYGSAFTTLDAAAKLFWESISKQIKNDEATKHARIVAAVRAEQAAYEKISKDAGWAPFAARVADLLSRILSAGGEPAPSEEKKL